MRKRTQSTSKKTGKIKPHILLTGATGFVGRRLLQRLLDTEYRVTVITSGDAAIPAHANLHVLSCDLTDYASVSRQRKKLEQCDQLVHLASIIPQGNESDLNFDVAYRMNIAMVQHLLQVVYVKKIVFTSTLDVYGPPQKLPVREDHPYNPQTIYALSKVAAEEMLRTYESIKNVPVTILRLSNVYGEYDSPIKVIPRVIRMVYKGERPLLFGDGSDTRDYIYVDDVVKALFAVVRKTGANAAGTFNIATGKEVSIGETIDRIIRASGRNVKPKKMPRQKEKTRIRLDVTAASKKLGFRANTNFIQGIQKTVRAERPIIVFDFDGTLLNNSDRYYALYRDLLPETVKKPLSKKAFWDMKRAHISEDDIIARTGLIASERKKYHTQRMKLIESADYLRHDTVFPWAKELLTTLSKDYSLMLLSLRRKPQAFQKQLLTLGIEKYFDHIIAAEPEEFGSSSQTKAEIIGSLDGNVVAMIGDTDADIRASHELGIPGFAVLTGIRTEALLQKEKPTAILQDARGLKKYLEKQSNT